MASHKIVTFDTLMLESDIHELLGKLNEVRSHIKLTVPDEVIFQANGEPNVRTHWGAIYHHVTMAHVSLKAFTNE